MFEHGQRITVPDPDDPQGRVVATFLEVAVGKPATISDPRVEGGTRKVDQAWVRYEDGTAGLVPFFEINPAA